VREARPALEAAAVGIAVSEDGGTDVRIDDDQAPRRLPLDQRFDRRAVA